MEEQKTEKTTSDSEVVVDCQVIKKLADNTELTFKKNDVYNFRYKPEIASKSFEPYHCFDGQLLVIDKRGELCLSDSYWGWGDNSSRTFKIDEAIEKGELKFVCNLEQVVAAHEEDRKYYDDNDFINLSRQHNCYNKYAIKVGAKRSQQKMLETIKEKIRVTENEIKYRQSDLVRYGENLLAIEGGDLEKIWY